ncbi:MAG TPA: class I SAM-dependent methyltransferase [Solirubrobacteraceae bacterium]|nr:class I SAM-dependent methyltransferase [Solirubrobacteraceae bacterium]
MAIDPLAQSQLYVRRVRRLLRRQGVLPALVDGGELGVAARDRYFAKGREQIANLAQQIETHTGAKLESRRALDYGCGRGRMALPLAERCERVYGLDVAPKMLSAADRNAKRMNISNVEWMDVGQLERLSASYDLVISFYVFQHIPSREGERIFATLLRGLRAGGVGAVHFTLRPSRVKAEGPDPAKSNGALRRGPRPDARSRFSSLNPSYLYLLMNSYSLNRLGAVLADAGVSDWHVNWHKSRSDAGEPYPSAVIIFRKD